MHDICKGAGTQEPDQVRVQGQGSGRGEVEEALNLSNSSNMSANNNDKVIEKSHSFGELINKDLSGADD